MIRKSLEDEGEAIYNNQVHKTFYRNVPEEYVKTIECQAIPKLGLFELLNCLIILQIETNTTRHLVIDISCLCKNVDLRLILVSKKILTELLTGKLRWPLKKEGTGVRFSIQAVWHTESKYFQGPTTKLRLRHINRYNFQNSTGEVSWEVKCQNARDNQTLDGSNAGWQQGRDGGTSRNIKSKWEEFLSC
ncbi:hypothetical protein AMTR_s00117p00088610 [Amborella trichopoda]|uniref:DUF7903 domain-containing protein n=1 Tax=Amborella trichopoda TaxID=13333 RepID=W1NSW4_AMBTC|nr:hypothetical protein AMTR_s00117p00088610 [Amborella trichopoda]